MQTVTPLQIDELMILLIQRVEANRVDLVNRYRKSLQNNIFANRIEMRPSEVGKFAAEAADALISGLPHPNLGVGQGDNLCQMGLGEQTVLALNQCTRQFILAIFEKDLIPQVLDIVDTYQNAIIRGYIQSRERLILAEQEQIRGALQIAIGRFTIEIKDIQEMAQRATEANDFKTRFIARVSHELRTPLGALLGMSEMLQQSVYGPLTLAQLDITERIINNTRTLERVFAELLDQSQIESGQLRLRRDSFSPKVMASTVHENNLSMALKKGLTMQLRVDPNLPGLLIGDKERTEQVLSNLVVNAIKYTQAGRIEIHVSKNGPARWIMQVKDTGIGISDEDRIHIFEPFRQADETVGRRFGGVGLGLAIVYQLVTAMGGTIDVESKVGYGSIFTVTLPLHNTKSESG
jgi:signal transduction histidine kinase